VKRRTLRLRAETLRQLADLGDVAGGRPTSYPQCAAARPATSEAVDGEPCPGEYSFLCKP